MQATRIFIDSEPVFISGEGRMLLDSETVDLKLHGEPKRLRLMRIKAPVLVQGTLLQPKFSIGAADSGLRLVDCGTPTMPTALHCNLIKPTARDPRSLIIDRGVERRPARVGGVAAFLDMLCHT